MGFQYKKTWLNHCSMTTWSPFPWHQPGSVYLLEEVICHTFIIGLLLATECIVGRPGYLSFHVEYVRLHEFHQHFGSFLQWQTLK